FDLGELPGQLGDLDQMTPEELAELDVADLLEEMFAEINRELGDIDTGDMPSLSVPFDLDIFGELDLGELGEMGTMSPVEIQELVESQLGDLEATIGSLPDVPPMPPMSIPVDPSQIEDCLSDLG